MPPEKPIKQETLRIYMEPEDNFLSEKVDTVIARWMREHPKVRIVGKVFGHIPGHPGNAVSVTLRYRDKEVS